MGEENPLRSSVISQTRTLLVARAPPPQGHVPPWMCSLPVELADDLALDLLTALHRRDVGVQQIVDAVEQLGVGVPAVLATASTVARFAVGPATAGAQLFSLNMPFHKLCLYQRRNLPPVFTE